MTLQELVQEVRALSVDEQKELIKLLVDIVAEPSQETRTPKRSITELRGLGKEIWAGIDAQEYVNQQRNEWDKHP